jgi:hypothetical protein
MPSYTVPKDIRLLVQRAYDYNLSLPIAQRAAYKDDGDKRVQGTGMKTAKKLMSGVIDDAQLDLMIAWFARHAESPGEAEARQDKTSKAAIAWALWGGNPGYRWIKQQKRANQ